MNLKLQARLFLGWSVSVFVLAFGTSSQAAELALADSPLFLSSQVDPNVFFLMDDSGSMDWEILTNQYHEFQLYSRGSSSGLLAQQGFFVSRKCDGGTRYFAYMYSKDTNKDNIFGKSCDLGRLQAGAAAPAIEDWPQAFDTDWRVGSSDVNAIYYDPSVNYIPWTGYPEANFFAVHSNPHPSSIGYRDTRNLANLPDDDNAADGDDGFRYNVWQDTHGFDNDRPAGPGSANDTPNGIVDLWDSFVEYTVQANKIIRQARDVPAAGKGFIPNGDANQVCWDAGVQDDPPYSRCWGTTKTESIISGDMRNQWGRTVTEEQKNVANWYQYARRRSFVAKGAVISAVRNNPGLRFGYAQARARRNVFVGLPDNAKATKDYTAHNDNLINTMANWKWINGNTPLPRGLEYVGAYYYGGANGSKVKIKVGNSSSAKAFESSPFSSRCQQAYAVLLTDGSWSGGPPYFVTGDQDNDRFSGSLADVAHFFYANDLSTLADEVPTTATDPAKHQHMVTFTVAFGVQGNLKDSDGDGYPDTDPKTKKVKWHDGKVDSDAEKIDDLWHAAINSKGRFLSAKSASALSQAFDEVLSEVNARMTGSSASVAVNSGSLNAGSKLFQARFDSADWKGHLLAYKTSLKDNRAKSTLAWDAGVQLKSQNYNTGREIITFNPSIDNPPGDTIEGAGIPFRFPADYSNPTATELTSSQVAELMPKPPHVLTTAVASQIAANQQYGTDLVNYFRGDQTHESSGHQFRARKSVLGDIINSAPNFVGAPNSRYADSMEAKSYAAFVTANASRQGMVYVGANDGMLHGFNSDTGLEEIAYVPTPVYENLADLASAKYTHRYFVDGAPNIVDVFMSNTDDPASATSGLWRTVLAGGLNAGGQGIYALDVTDPSRFDEANAGDIVLWEFTDDDDPDLGYTFGKVQMAKMHNGRWAAVFGNGYNNSQADGTPSATGNAVLFIVDVGTGEIIRKIDTGAGSVDTPNGLATPLLIDANADQVADYIYAGDLQGNMWKFDVSDINAANWDVAWERGGSPVPLFTAQAGQKITSQPQATFHPDNRGGFMVYFGTGAYLERKDNSATGQVDQAFYGIWDKNESDTPGIALSDLLGQSIENQYDKSFDTNADGVVDETYSLRDVSNNAIDWGAHKGWYIDLKPTHIEGAVNARNFGERQVSKAVVRNGRVIFTTLVPSAAECDSGGTSYLMQLDFRDGGALEFPAFDLNGDGEFDLDDTLASGRASKVGIMPAVVVQRDGAQDRVLASGSSGDIETIQIGVGAQSYYGRQSWRRLE